MLWSRAPLVSVRVSVWVSVGLRWKAVVGGCGGRLWWVAVGACGSMYRRSIAASRGTWRVGAGPPLRAWAWTATRSWCSEACVVRGRAWARVGVAYPAWARPLL